MCYLNAHDMPEHARSVFESAANGDSARITTRFGTAVVISQAEYDRLSGQENSCCSGAFQAEHDLERFYRDEVDF